MIPRLNTPLLGGSAAVFNASHAESLLWETRKQFHTVRNLTNRYRADLDVRAFERARGEELDRLQFMASYYRALLPK